jgi:hypothetical protein
MQRSTLLTVAGILIVISSCLALVASLFMGLFIWADYFHPSHLGSVRAIREAFYVEVSITIFELSAFVLGLLSAVNIFKSKKFSLSALGASFLIISGLLFFAKFLYNYLPHVEAIFQSFWSPIPQPYFGLPIIILASISIILLVSRRKEFDDKEINPLAALEAILILCSITSASFAIFSIVPYEQVAESARIQHSAFPNHDAYSLLATMIVSICSFIFSTLAGLLLFKKSRFYASVGLIVLSLITALSLPFIFMSIYPWIGSFFKGLVTESPLIALLAIALILALLGQRNVTKKL